MTVRFFALWRDLWVGAYVDAAHKAVYLCPVPCLGVKITWGESEAPSYDDLATHVEQLQDALDLCEKQVEVLEDAAEFYAEPHRWRQGEDNEPPDAIADEGQAARSARAKVDRLRYKAKAPRGAS
jgi:hypothetical protein